MKNAINPYVITQVITLAVTVISAFGCIFTQQGSDLKSEP